MDRLVTVAQQYAQSAHAAPPQPQRETMQPTDANQLDDDLLVTNPGEWRRRFAAQQQNAMNATVASVAAPFAAQLAGTVATLAKRDPANADVAERWWGEVEAIVAPIPEHMRTEALYSQAAKIARSNHVDEIANERAQRLAASGSGVEGVTRVANADGTVSTVDAAGPVWDKIKATPLGARQIERYGRAKVEAAAKAMGGLDKYAAMLEGSRTEFDPSHPSRMYSELING